MRDEVLEHSFDSKPRGLL